MFRDPISIADRVWLYPPNHDLYESNVGIICTDTQAIVVDAGNSPRHARNIMVGLSIINAPPVRHLIFTHHHWDHTFGASIFVNPNIIAHELCAQKMEQYRRIEWTDEGLREDTAQNSRHEMRNQRIRTAMGDWRGFHVCVPDMVFSNQLALHIDDLKIEIQHVGGRHAPDSVTVGIPDRGVKFIADCFYQKPAHEQDTESDAMLNTILLKSLLDDRYHTYIDGHSEPMSREDVEKLIQESES